MGILDVPGYSRAQADGRFALDRPRRREKPSAGLVRVSSEATLMDTPPTIGAVSSSSAISPPTDWLAISGTVQANQPFDYTGVAFSSAQPESGTYPGDLYMRFRVPDHTNAPTAPYRMRFYFDGTNFEFRFHNYNGYKLSILVDGQKASASPLSLTGSPEIAFLPVTFSTRAVRLIEIVSQVPIRGIRTAQTDTIWKPAPAAYPRVVILGDSYTQGTGSTAPGATDYVATLANLMGWTSVVRAAVGGSGYLNGGQASKTFAQRIAADVIPFAPELLLIVGGHNDTPSSNAGFTTAAFTAAADALYSDLRTALPDAFIVAVGPLGHQSTNNNYANMQAAMTAEAAGVLDGVIDTMTVPWFTGTGSVGSTTGVGNDDYFFTNSDIQHPNQAGHSYIASRLSAELARLLPA